jgi:hypothetical protein
MKKIVLLSLFFALITSCGFKVVETKYLENISISEINTVGDSKTNYKIKSNLNNILNAKGPRKIKIDIETQKEKIIKEKNINNIVKKYQIEIKSKVTFEFIKIKKKYIYNFKKTAEYGVKDRNIKNLNTEKKIINSLSKEISNQIINKLELILNDL